jgi:hypothetical protein
MRFEVGDRVRLLAFYAPNIQEEPLLRGRRGTVREVDQCPSECGPYYVEIDTAEDEADIVWWFRACDLTELDSPCNCWMSDPPCPCPVHEVPDVTTEQVELAALATFHLYERMSQHPGSQESEIKI